MFSYESFNIWNGQFGTRKFISEQIGQHTVAHGVAVHVVHVV